jgi:hypothetical protein
MENAVDENDPRMRQHDAWDLPDMLYEAFKADAPIEDFREILQAHNPDTLQTINVRRLFHTLRWAIAVGKMKLEILEVLVDRLPGLLEWSLLNPTRWALVACGMLC